MKTTDIVIVGGGIAGLSAAWILARGGDRKVLLLEREEVFATHSTGRNAAIFRQLDGSPGGVELAVRSRALLDPLLADRGGWLTPTGALYVAGSAAALDVLKGLAERFHVDHRLLDRSALEARVPALRGGFTAFGLEVPGDGVVDVHGVCSALADEARAAGAILRTRIEAARVTTSSGRVQGVVLASGERIEAGAVVIAAGAWAAALGETAGAPLPLRPLRRHVAILEADPPLPAGSPVVWCVDDEAYFRPESGGVLASPCDEDAYEPCLPPESPSARELLAEKLARIAPPLAGSGVRRGWGGLRTFAPDRAMVIGPDPRVEGLSWLAGLGGHGVTAGVAAAELLVSQMRGDGSLLGAALAPQRLVSAPAHAGGR